MNAVSEHWHFRKEFSIGTIIVLMVYGVMAVVSFTKLSERQLSTERSVARLIETTDRVAVAEERVAMALRNVDRLEERTVRELAEIKSILQRIERQRNPNEQPR